MQRKPIVWYEEGHHKYQRCTCADVMKQEEDESQPIVSLIDNANLSIVLPFGLSFTPTVEFYQIRSEGRTDNFVLLDCGLGYTFRKVKFTLDVNNILDTQSFVYSYYSGIYGYYSAYSIRPRSVMLGVRFKMF